MIKDIDKYFRVKYNKVILKTTNTRDEAVKYCEQKARSFVPVRVSPSEFVDNSVVFTIELVQNKKVVTKELYTVIVVMKR